MPSGRFHNSIEIGVSAGRYHNGIVLSEEYHNGILVYTSQSPSGSQTFTSSGTFTVPQGYTEVTICMIGGGGSGGACAVPVNNPTGALYSGGGYSGEIVSQVVSGLTSGQVIAVTIGSGGAGVSGYDVAGNAGTETVFGSIVANGGAGGGATTFPYYGEGGARVISCLGITTYDGSSAIFEAWGGGASGGYGGQAGFGNGGTLGGSGGVGAGGAGHIAGTISGAGGRGELVVSWVQG